MSVFEQFPQENWLAENEYAFAIFDHYPVSSGHVLVITKRIVPTWFEASSNEQIALMSLVNDVKRVLDDMLQPKPDGYNVGFNAGEAAGQTVMHLHVHVIPRYQGDVPDPRGGVRHVIPGKGNYLAVKPQLHTPQEDFTKLILSTGYPNSKLWDQLSLRIIGATQVDVLSSFVQNSGLDVIEGSIFQALRRKISIRIMVSDYLFISDPDSLKRLLDWRNLIAEDREYSGELAVRLVEVAKLPSQPHSFHPKSWRIIDTVQSFIAVGSSNLSRPALESGIEWNLLSTTCHHSKAHEEFATEFERLWFNATPLSVDVVIAYSSKAKEHRRKHFEPESKDDRFLPQPRPWQQRALKALTGIREAGYRKALVAVATGMGKTWLAAFDLRNFAQELGRRPRVLVIAHRSHLLVQAESALSTILEQSFGKGITSWFIGDRSELDGSLVVASIQKLARPEGIRKLSRERFDYVMVDEVHHAHAPTYRRVLAQLSSSFVLGLTATPERGDGIDVASIFDDNLAFHATIGDGIGEDCLVPFHYVGIRDTVDFQQIPWRNSRFDIGELEKRLEQSERMQCLWTALQNHPGERTLVFCCSRRHAMFSRDWLRDKGLSSAAVFSGDGSDGQIESLEALRSGQLQVLCVVDMFNEGLDIPTVDRIVMLRPTESKVVFLQQLGRGLRAAEGKTRLLVIDFVGNHRIFGQRMLHLLSLGGKDAGWAELRNWLNGEAPKLPQGCLLEVDLEAKDVIAQFLPSGATAGVESYRMMREELGRRPMAVELLARNILPRAVSQATGSWFDFVESEGDLRPDEQEVLKRFRSWLITVETTSLNKSYKMVVLRVLLDYDDLFKQVELHAFSLRCRRFMLQNPVLRRDLLEGVHALNHRDASDEAWAKWWRQWPIDRWVDKQNGQHWFKIQNDCLRWNVDCPAGLRTTLRSTTEELVEWRLAAYTRSRRLTSSLDSDFAFEAKVSHAGGKAILFLPDKTKLPDRPVGLVHVLVPDGSEWEFKFVKVACNIARPVGSESNELTALLRRWFGDNAGQPGTDYKVIFEHKNGKWNVRPIRLT